jgi:hypothetical protein
LRTWSPFPADRNHADVGEVTLTMLGESPEENQDLPSIVTRAEAPSVLAFTWGPDLVQWELRRVGAGTRLTLRHTIADHQMLSAVAAGWHLCLDAAAQVLRGTPGPSVIGHRAQDFGWDELNARYAVARGVRASQVW